MLPLLPAIEKPVHIPPASRLEEISYADGPYVGPLAAGAGHCNLGMDRFMKYEHNGRGDEDI